MLQNIGEDKNMYFLLCSDKISNLLLFKNGSEVGAGAAHCCPSTDEAKHLQKT